MSYEARCWRDRKDITGRWKQLLSGISVPAVSQSWEHIQITRSFRKHLCQMLHRPVKGDYLGVGGGSDYLLKPPQVMWKPRRCGGVHWLGIS